ncbi:hypothetical protein, partial [Pseudonocardia sp.]|uniref:hypothetical protein n=1 Tax=Pseudonocardia sp. TaxID=60912 RepID=UPI0026136267
QLEDVFAQPAAIDKWASRLDAGVRATTLQLNAAVTDNTQSSSGDVNVVLNAYNPVPETSSDTAARKLRTVAAMVGLI